MYKCIGGIVENFSFDEMANKLDGELKIDTKEAVEHAYMMQELREWGVRKYPAIFGKSGLTVSSWYRTVAFNKKCSGASNSAHLNARATDITNIPKNLHGAFCDAWELICSVHNKVGGCELANNYVHFDSYSDKFGCKAFRKVCKY